MATIQKKNFYFAYGSNMSEQQLIDRGVHYSSLCRGVLQKYKLVFNKPADVEGAGYENIDLDSKEQVEGIVYETDDVSLEKLDKYEGVKSGSYHREVIEVKTEKELVCCIVYVAVKTAKGLKPKRIYLNKLLAGKKYLSKEYFMKLQQTETFD